MSDRGSQTWSVFAWNWFRQPRHVHDFGAWTMEERVYKLLGPYGKTENPEYFNVRVCQCGYREMHRIRTGKP